MGRKPKPAEVKRRNGNPGKGLLPDTANQVTLQIMDTPPPVPDGMGVHGTRLWQETMASPAQYWIAGTDLAGLEQLCRVTDEWRLLMDRVNLHGNWRDRVGLRALGAERLKLLAELGLTPTGRSTLGVAEVRIQEGVRRLNNGRKGTHEEEDLKPDLPVLEELEALEVKEDAILEEAASG